MPLLAPKRPRPPRAASRVRPAPAASRFDDLLRDQSRLLRWLSVVAAVVALEVALESWREPFPYRLGDYTADGIAARVPFGVVDEYATRRARDERADQVPPVFRLDPAPLEPLAGELKRDLEQVAAAEQLDKLAAPARADFGLQSADPAADATEFRGDFETLKAALRPTPGSNENRPEQIAAAFEPVVAALRANGVVTVEELSRNNIPPDGSIEIARAGRAKPEVVPTGAVLLANLTAKDGRIGRMIEADPQLTTVAPLLRRWLMRRAPVTLRYEPATTAEARLAARGQVERILNPYNPGDLLVPPGGRVGEKTLPLLAAEYDAIEAQTTPIDRAVRAVMTLLLIVVLTALNGFFVSGAEPRLFRSPARLAVYLAAVVLTVALGRFLSLDPYRAEVIPLIAVATVLSIAYDQLLATVTAFTVSALVVLSTTADLGHFVTLTAVSAAAVLPLGAVDSRSRLIKIGFLTALVFVAVSLGLGLLEQGIGSLWGDADLPKRSVVGALWCLVASYFVAGSLPFVESLFGVVTDVSLLEMTDVSHPLLQELVRRAPGTYNHSMTVATIGETAADAIGANGLLVRVGAYFHDVGKMLKPQYFVENMTEGQRSRHEQLAPAMSTLIIIGHVRDGADLAREHNLPHRVIDFIEQHHGTTLVEYFYREATRLADQTPDHKADAEESAFRYPGPKPQSKETGVLMLSDAVESASRTLSEPTPKRIESLVRGIALKRLLDGQFDESGLTLNEIRVIEDSLIKSLIGIYHGRIKYPDQKQD
jgi:putative nucleotidyltransferase with HDIG domain